jgi:hypothetical protein
MTLIQTKKIKPFPVFLIDRKYWTPLIDWFKNTLVATNKIEEHDLDILTMVDEPDELIRELTRRVII